MPPIAIDEARERAYPGACHAAGREYHPKVAGKPPYSVSHSVIGTMHRATAELIESGAGTRALGAGDKAPAFALDDPDGHLVSSADLLPQGALVVSFYRDVWCSYCNMELQALQASLPELLKQISRWTRSWASTFIRRCKPSRLCRPT
jgi:hypothetical protein